MSTLRRVPSGWPRDRNERGEAEGMAAVSDFEAGEMRYIFVRLAPIADSGEAMYGKMHTFTSEATVDLDADGNVMGIMVAWVGPR